MEMEMIISLPNATIGICKEFVDGEELIEKTVIITPLRLTVLNPDSQKISFGCNWWKSCLNKDCSYCAAGMPER
jgi:hypothetical protein